MVINKKARIWGFAEPSSELAISFLDKVYKATASDNGRFECFIQAEKYGGPYKLTIGDAVIDEVYVGHVWLCAGQSNMEQPMLRARPLLDAYIKEATHIHAFQAQKGMKFDAPACDTNAKWQTATGDFLENIFAVPYFFAQALELGTPIGLVNVAAGGTPVEAWLPEEIIRTFPGMYEKLAPYKQPGYMENLDNDSNIRNQAWHSTLHEKDLGIKESWHCPKYNSDHWPKRMLTDTAGLPEHGAVWYRKDIMLESSLDAASITLGRATDSVKVYVNGTEVISVDYQYPPCRGVVPTGVLKPGKNTIAVRLVGAGNKMHFMPGKEYKLEVGGETISLLDPWKCNVGHEMPQAEPAVWHYNVPTCTYNYMLAPVLGYSVDGVIWYQGESNTASPQGYKDAFAALVTLLRESVGEDIPVIFTQLANYITPDGTGENWAELREQQLQCLSIPNTAMAVAIDCGEWNDLHPQDKKTVGERLALGAKRLAYGQDIVYSGPIATRASTCDGEITIYFDHADGLWASNGRPLVEIIDDMGMCHHLYGVIEDSSITVNAGNINAKQVRFGWTDCPTVVLYNAHNLPGSPFVLDICNTNH